MAIKRTPPLGTVGRYTLRTPWSVSTERVYRCEAIRSFADIVERGMDVYERFYLPTGLGKEAYEQDRRLGANIITLMSDQGPVVYVPDTYIESYPNMAAVTYHHVVLSCSLGAIPEFLDLAYVQQQVANVVRDTLGLTPVVKYHSAPHTEFISPTQHEYLEANRTAALGQVVTDHGRIRTLQNENTALRQQLAALEQIIKDHGLLE